MAWRKRGTREYYYRSVRRDGRVEKIYCGSGTEGRTAAKADRILRELRLAARLEASRAIERVEALADPVRDLAAGVDTLLAEALLRAGFHCHRGEWRRRRERTTDGAADC